MKLSYEDLVALIGEYQSEIKQLKYKTDLKKAALKELKQEAKEKKPKATGKKRGRPAKSTTTTTKKRRGRPPKAKSTTTTTKKRRGRPPKAKSTTTTTKKRRGRPPKAKSTTTTTKKRRGRPPKAKSTTTTTKKDSGGYRLNPWDEFILNTLASKGKVMSNTEIVKAAQESDLKKEEKETKKSVEGKIVRSIHKLANRRGLIIKVKKEGRGYNYGLPEWSAGKMKVKPEFQA